MNTQVGFDIGSSCIAGERQRNLFTCYLFIVNLNYVHKNKQKKIKHENESLMKKIK